MEQLLALRLADLPKPVNVGIITPSDRNQIIVAAWRSGNINLSKEEVKSL